MPNNVVKTLEKINKLFGLMGLEESEVTINADEENRRIFIVIDDETIKTQVPSLLSSLEHLLSLSLRKESESPCTIDINYYRRERERLIADLARAAAHKAMVTKSEVELPPMNAYERRLVHLEITSNPSLKTESVGLGKSRRVVIKHF